MREHARKIVVALIIALVTLVVAPTPAFAYNTSGSGEGVVACGLDESGQQVCAMAELSGGAMYVIYLYVLVNWAMIEWIFENYPPDPRSMCTNCQETFVANGTVIT